VTIHLCGLPGSIERCRPLPAWPCSGWGLPSHTDRSACWCALTAPFQPCLWPVNWPIGGLSLLHSRQVTPTWLSPAPCPVESRLSSTRSCRAAVTRPTPRRPQP